MVSMQWCKGILLVTGLTGLILADPESTLGQAGDGAATQKN